MNTRSLTFDHDDDLRFWIEELTNYAPQKVDEVLEKTKPSQNAVISSQIRTYFLFSENKTNS